MNLSLLLDLDCFACKAAVTNFEAKFINDDGTGTTNTSSTLYIQLEDALINGCNQLVANNEEYLTFCTTGVTTFLPAVVSGLIRDYPAERLCKLFGLCADLD